MKTAWSETESQQFWNNARVLELLKMDLRAQQQNLQKEHVNLNSTSFMIYQMKKSFLQPSLYPHLLNPPYSKARHVQTENLLRDTVLRKLCQRIELYQSKDSIDDQPDEVFTVPNCSTPQLGDIYN